ncbi:MAG: adenosine deaminase [Chloroflexota bacterium]|nr:MAG: adenosine deaminase [Chloroflexota bacterium]
MSIDSYLRAIPKVELYVQLEGAMQKDTLLMIAEQNDIADSVKHFRQWVALIEQPDSRRLDELVRVTSTWLQQPDDLTRLVYELGVSLAKQNVRYAEVGVSPLLYMENGLTFEQFLAAINDGRDRAARGWGVQLAWLLMLPRDQPRRADDFLRWVTSAAAKRGGVVGLGLIGAEDAQPAAQFERPFRNAVKKGVPRIVQAGDVLGGQGILDVVTHLEPDRIIGGWGALESPDALNVLVEQHIPLSLSIAHDVRRGAAASYADYPLRRLLDEGVTVTLGTGMPELYKTNLTQEYLAAYELVDGVLEEIEEIALNAVRASLLPDDEKQRMLAVFSEEYARLRAEHVTPAQA